MIASSLIEALAALSVAASVLGTLTAALAASATTSVAAWRLAYKVAESRQIEHLIDTTIARTLAADGSIVACTINEVVFEADIDHNGLIDSESSERTAFAISAPQSGQRKLSQRLGRQSMTISDALATDATIRCSDSNMGHTSDPALVKVVEIPIAAGSTRLLSISVGG